MNFYKRFMGDYARGTAHLSLAEHGAYSLLLDYYYATEKGLPDDMVALYRICRAFSPEEQQAVSSVAEQYFPIGDDGLRHNTRADEQIEDDSTRIDAARANGKRGGRPRKTQAKPSGLQDENPMGFENETQTEPNENPEETQDESSPQPEPDAHKPNGLFAGDSRAPTRTHGGHDTVMTSCPSTLEPTRAHRGIAANQHLDLDNELAMFLAHAREKAQMSADWNASFEKWLRRSRNFGGGKDQRQPAKTSLEEHNREAMRLAKARIFGTDMSAEKEINP
ncbi:YdaU family protein [Paludibacterium purpuratum]|uniref:Uncharacterized protein YdaU (DUF1376 family) n=1 Tax=Paludibacterium purpuratum TaxID=1144873 RepID=A0A4R7BEJ4_9NEIS|nr:YdaU family protein [Paludibacterium purpuratum]TDR82186.1 uncharacterized protein YdaU (DUF1376 family) [Paludibacterium purpuratum]